MLTIEEVKQYLHLDSDAEDDYLRILIILAGEMCEKLYNVLQCLMNCRKAINKLMLVCIGYFFEQRDGTKNGVLSIFLYIAETIQKGGILMDFSKLRHRVIFLKPLDKRLNSMNENVPVWIPFKPKLSGDINADETSVYVLTDNKGNAVWKSAGGGQLYSHQLSLNEYAVWANVFSDVGD